MKNLFIVSLCIGLANTIASVFITFVIGIGSLLPLTIAALLLLYIFSGFAFGFLVSKSKWWHFFIAAYFPFFLFIIFLVSFYFINSLKSSNLFSTLFEILPYSLVPLIIYEAAGFIGKRVSNA